MHRLDEVVDTLLVLQKKHRIRFDVWLVVKRDHAIISFFDQGMNPAVPRVTYWGTVAKLAMRQPFVLFKGLTFQKLCLPGAFRPGDHHNKMLRPG
ncbi:hypothetical protein J4U77_22240, partial [Escherichia coli]